MINPDLFSKYNNFTFRESNTLFPIEPIVAIKHRVCPYCFNKLYLMKSGKFYYCKSKKHKNKFLISKTKMDY